MHGRRYKNYQCRSCRHQATLTAGKIMEATKLPLAIGFPTFYLVGQANIDISSMALIRHLGVRYHTNWLVHSEIMRTMVKWEGSYLLRGRVQLDDAYLGGQG